MKHHPTFFKVSYNPWFIFPFLLWMIIGSILFIFFDKEQLFFAVNTHNNHFLDVFMRGITELGDGTGIILILLCVWLLPPFRTGWFLLAIVLCNALPAIVIQVIKSIMDVPRPQAIFAEATWLHLVEDWPKLYSRSFPSGHTAGAFSLFCFLSLLLPRRFAPFGLFFFFIALAVGYSRMYLAAHFYRDVFVGSLLGTAITLAAYRSIRQWHGKFFRLRDPEPEDAETSDA